MEKKKLLITGKDGLVGNALQELGDFLFVGRKDADLTKENEVANLFKELKPDWVIHTAAKVGGIGGNMACHAEYFHQNILMNTHVIHHAWLNKVEKLLVFSSVCVFPDGLPILHEDLMHKGEPFSGNFAYAHAKRMVDIQIQAYESQYGVKNYCSIIPANIFGKHDLYNIKHAHVVPSLIHKIYLAKKENKPLHVWGDGSSLREFIYAKDMAQIILDIIHLSNIPSRIIISSERQHSIKQIVEMLCKVSSFTGEVVWETDKPNGQRARRSDLSLLRSLVQPKYTDLEEALAESYKWFEENFEKVRK